MIEIQRYIDLFKQYQRIPAKEEREMLVKIRTPPPGVDPEAKSWKLTEEQQACADEFIYRNIRLAIHEAKKFCSPDDPRMIDLICAGVEGMVYSLGLFDISKEVRFSTYAVWWIKARIRQQLKATDTRAIRWKTLDKDFKQVRNQCFKEKKLWTEEQIFAELKWSAVDIERWKQDQVCLRVSLDHIDLTKSDFESHDSELYVEDPKDEVLDRLHKDEQLDLMREAFKTLTAEEIQIITMYYGLKGESMTYDQLTLKTGIAREKLRAKERKALRKLWRYMRIKQPSLCD